jgi:hypothetical protein
MSAQAFFPGGVEAGPTLWRLNELSGAELQGRFRSFFDANRRRLQVPRLEFERLTRQQIAALQHGYLLWEIVKATFRGCVFCFASRGATATHQRRRKLAYTRVCRRGQLCLLKHSRRCSPPRS